MKALRKYFLFLMALLCAVAAQAADTTPPTVTAVNPAAGATNVWLDASVTATFSEAMSSGTINSGTFVVRKGLASVDGIVAYNSGSKTVSFTPYAPFLLGTTYTAMVTTDVQDAAGNHMAEVYVWNFTATTNTSTPYVISIFPGDTDVGIGQNEVIEATFSEHMASDTLDATSFLVVTDLGDIPGTKIAGSVFYDVFYRTAFFTPAADLDLNTPYFAVLTTSVKNAGGNPLDADFSWTFTTTNHSHTITATWATTGTDPDVWTSAPITVTFSDPMMGSTIDVDTFTLKQGVNTIPGTVYYNAVQKKATFVSDAPLAANTAYTATLTTGIYCAQGVSFAGDTFGFTTTSDATLPTVSATSPVNGAANVWTSSKVTATFLEAMSPASITGSTFILKKGAVKVACGAPTYDGPSKTATLTPSSALETGVLYTAILSTGVKDANGNPLSADLVWTFTTTSDSTAPQISTKTPDDLATEVSKTAKVVVVFDEAMEPSTIDDTSLVLHTDSGDIAGTTVPVTVSVSGDNKTVTLTPSSSFTANTDYYVMVAKTPVAGIANAKVVKDASGNTLASDVSWTFKSTTDVAAPTTLNASPADTDTEVWLDSAVSIEFSEAMDASTITSSTFSLDNSATGVVTYDAGTYVATFTPNGGLDADTTYTATLTTDITDAKGNPLAGNVTWSFTTTNDTTGPTASMTAPAATTNVWLDSVIDITFNDDMTSSTIDDTTITVSYGSPAVQIPGNVSYVAGTGSGVATFSPDSPLDANTLYTVKVLPGIKDSTGNPVGETTFTFTTTADAVKPTVIDFSPSAGATNVWLSKAVTVTFSEDIDNATLDENTSFKLTDAGTPVAGNITYAANTATYTPDAPLTGNKTYVVTLTNAIRDTMGNRLSSGISFSFTTTADSTAPTVSSTVPANSATGVVLNPTVKVTFGEQMASSTMIAANVYLCPSSSTTTHLAAQLSYDAVTKSATIIPDALLSANTQYDINVLTGAMDANGNAIAGAFKASFTTVNDGAAPTITAVNPTHTSTSAWANSVITAAFNENVRSSTINPTTFMVTKDGFPIDGTVSYNDTTFVASFTPYSSLALGAQYTAMVTSGVMDIAGNSFNGATEWDFTVTTDVVAPTVSAVSPVDTTTNVWVDSTVTATFNESMSSASLSSANFTVKAGATPVAGVITYDDPSKTVTFTPSADLALGTTYTAKLTTSVKDVGGNALAVDKVWSFTTTADGVAPTVAGAYPVNGATGVSKLEAPSVTFSEGMLSTTLDTTNFSLDCAGAVAGSVSYSSANKTATFTPSAALSAGASCTATVKGAVSDLGGNILGSDYTFSFTVTNDGTAPTVVVETSPVANSGTVWTSAVVTATFSEPMTAASVNTTTISLEEKDTQTPVAGTLTYDTATRKATLTPNAPLTVSTTYVATVTTGATDAAGNALASNEVLEFTTTSDATAPTITDNSPVAGATGVWRDSTVTVTFSEVIDQTTLDGTTFFLKQGANSVAATLTYSAGVATLTPSAPLAVNSLYTCSVTRGVKDENGNQLANAHIFSFTTTSDSTQPIITTFTPADNATNVSRKPVISVTFNEPMTQGTINDTNIVVNNGAVTGSVSYNAGTRTATFTPASLLSTNTVYTVKVIKDVKDASGNKLMADGVWSFTTSNDGAQPSISSKSPVADATSVWPNAPVTVTFSEAVDLATLTSDSFNVKEFDTGDPVAGTITYDTVTDIASFNPTSAFTRGLKYTATVVDTIQDKAGNALSAGDTWDFSVSSDADAPVIASVFPADSATSVWTDSVVSAVFDENLEASTVTSAVFTLKQGTIPVAGAVAYDDANKKITFTPSSNLQLNKVYTATITTAVKDLGGNALAVSKIWSFTTSNDSVAPTVSSTSPANNAVTVTQLVKPTMTFSEAMAADTIDSTSVKLDSAGDVAGDIDFDATTHTITFTPAAPLTRSGVYTFTAKSSIRDVGGNKLAADAVISFTVTGDGAAPTVTGKFPANAEQEAWKGTTVTATFSEPMTASSISGDTFFLMQDTTTVPGVVTFNAGTNTATFTPNASLTADTEYTATVVASVTDAGGNSLGVAGNDDVTWTFKTTTDETAPTVVSTVPVNAATNVWASGAPVKVVFSEEMASSTITTSSFNIMQGTNVIAGTVAYDNDTLTATFTPTSALALNTAYTVTVTTGVKDKYGNSLASPVSMSFTTTADATKPTLTKILPAHTSTDVSRNPVISIIFSEAMTESTINATNILVNNGAVAGTVTYTPATRTAKFAVTNILDISTLYTVKVLKEVKDLNGNQLAFDFTWSFTTSSDNTQPGISSKTPVADSTTVWPNSAITVTFSEAMEVSTITSTTFNLKVTDTGVKASGTITYDSATKTARLTPSSALARGVKYTATVTTGIRDVAGNALSAGDAWDFTISSDATAPTITSVTPDLNATSVWSDTIINAVFSESMESTTITGGGFSLKQGTTPVEGVVSYDDPNKKLVFTPASNLLLNKVYTATITTGVKDKGGNPLASAKVWSFTTTSDTGLPTITSTSPADTDTSVSQLAKPTIIFSESMTASTINSTTLKLDKAGDVAGTVAYDAPSRTATFTPSAPLARSGVYTLTAKSDIRDLGGNKMTADKVVTFTVTDDNVAPTITAKYPLSAETDAWKATVVTATFDEAMTASSITGATFFLKQGATNVPGAVSYNAATKIASFTPTGNLTVNANYTATVVASVLDAGGNALGTAGVDDVTWSFKVTNDTTAPTITSTTPTTSATNVWCNGATVDTVFSESLATSTITKDTFYIMQGTTLVSGNVSYDDASKKASFTPSVNLALNTVYTAIVTTGVKDKNGNALAAQKTWTFTTTADAVKPNVSSTVPVLGATGVSRLPVINVVFSEAVNSASLAASFTLKKGATPVDFTTTYNSATKTGLYTPVDTLDANTIYTATVTTGVRDVAGNQLPANYSWTFTTSNDTVAPTIALLIPADLKTNVSTLSYVGANFSEPLTPSSVNSSSLIVTRTDVNPDVVVNGVVSYVSASKTAKFSPVGGLVRGATYSAKLTTAIRDANGNPLAAEANWSFEMTNDNVAPTVTATSPANGQTTAWKSAVVTATFNEDMTGWTFSNTTFTLKQGSSSVAGTVSYDVASKTAKFKPSAPLVGAAVYVANITTGVKDLAGTALAANKTWNFTVTTDGVLPTVTSVAPASLALNVNRFSPVKATFSEAMNLGSISTTSFTLKKGTTPITGTVAYDSATKTATFTPTAILPSGSVLTATVNGARDVNGNLIATPYTWTFTTTTDDVAPTIISKSPATGGTSVSKLKVITATFSEDMNATTITAANCSLKTAAPGNVPVTVAVGYDALTRTMSITPSAALALSQEYTMTIGTGIQDANGNAIKQVVWNFTTTDDNIVPVVDSMTPTTSATNVTILTRVVAHFNEPMTASTITGTSFTLKAGATSVAANISYDSATRNANLVPKAPLTRNTVYTATLTAGVTDLGGNPLALTSWTFTTTNDSTAPTVTSTSPANAATGVSMLTTVKAVFSEKMTGWTITNTSFTLKQGATNIPGTATYDSVTQTATFTPTSQLSRNLVYTATVTTGVKDLAGTPMAAAKTWTFTTTTDSVSPYITTRYPAPDVGGIGVTENVVVSFSEAISTAASAAGISLKQGSTTVPAALSWDGTNKTLTINPTADLDEGGLYTVSLTGAVKDLAGNSLQDLDWDFVVAPGTYIEPSTGIEFVWVNQGSFDMGDTFLTGQEDESPAHTVNITKGYWMGKYELTQAQWEGVAGSNPSSNTTPACPNCPVENISYDDVQTFLSQIVTLTGKNIDIPTEAQWEFAARGGANGAGFQYAGENTPDMVANYNTSAPVDVGSFNSNELGIYDMSGNVWEMVYDYYSSTEYTPDSQTDPSGPLTGTTRVVRGGGWSDLATELRVTNRDFVTESAKSSDTGVRLVFIP